MHPCTQVNTKSSSDTVCRNVKWCPFILLNLKGEKHKQNKISLESLYFKFFSYVYLQSVSSQYQVKAEKHRLMITRQCPGTRPVVNTRKKNDYGNKGHVYNT